MKEKRNYNVSKIFWTGLVLLLILGIILKLLGIKPITFPEEDSCQPTNPSSAQASTLDNESTSSIGNFEFTSESEFEAENSSKNELKIPVEETKEQSSTSTTEEPAISTIAPTENEITLPEPIQPPVEEVKPLGTIYLSFDDGPSLECTPQILDILKNHNIKATFFILDYQYGSKKEEIIMRAFEEGHTIGLHGTSHLYSEIYTSLDTLIKNFETLQEKVYNSLGYNPIFIRFPGGSSNTVSKNYCTGIMTEASAYFQETDFVYFDWNVDSQDAGGAFSAEEVFQNVTSSIKPDRNNVVLMHDSKNKNYTVEALEKIIVWALEQGYQFKAITKETPQVIHRIAN